MKTKRFILCAATAMFWFGQYIYVPYLNREMSLYGIAAGYIGMTVAAYGLTQMLLRIPLGLGADKTGRHKAVIAAGLLCAGLACAIMMAAKTPIWFIISRGVAGVASATWVCFAVVFTTAYPRDQITRAMGTANACNSFGQLCSYALGLALADRIGFAALCGVGIGVTVMGFLFFAGAMLFGKTQTNNAVVEKPAAVNRTKLITPRLLSYALLAALYQAVVFSTVQAFPSAQVVDPLVKQSALALAAILFVGANIAGSAMIGRKHAQKLGAHRLLAIGFSGMAAYCLGVSLATTLWQVMALQILGGLCGAAMLALCMAQSVAKTSPEKRAGAMGVFQAVYALGMTAGPYAMGIIVQSTGIRHGWQIAAGAALFAAVSGYFVGRRFVV